RCCESMQGALGLAFCCFPQKTAKPPALGKIVNGSTTGTSPFQRTLPVICPQLAFWNNWPVGDGEVVGGASAGLEPQPVAARAKRRAKPSRTMGVPSLEKVRAGGCCHRYI